MTSIYYKYICICLLKIMHYLKEKINSLNNIFYEEYLLTSILIVRNPMNILLKKNN